jgi:hypothetical protein
MHCRLSVGITGIIRDRETGWRRLAQGVMALPIAPAGVSARAIEFIDSERHGCTAWRYAEVYGRLVRRWRQPPTDSAPSPLSRARAS